MEYKEVININIWWKNNNEIILETKSPYECVKKLMTKEMENVNSIPDLINIMSELTTNIAILGYGTNFIYKGYMKGLERRINVNSRRIKKFLKEL